MKVIGILIYVVIVWVFLPMQLLGFITRLTFQAGRSGWFWGETFIEWARSTKV